MKAKKKNKNTNTQPQASSVRLQHDPIPSALTPLKEFNYTPDEDTYDALRFLASWYNSDQYAGMEHDRGRDSDIPGRHILQTPYGRSRMGNRYTPYERAVRIAYSPKLNTNNTDMPSHLYGEYNSMNEGVSINSSFQDKPSALVHELYHGAEGVVKAFTGDPEGNTQMAALDRRFTSDSNRGLTSREEVERFAASNPYTPKQWADRMFGDDWTSSTQRYVNEPAEITARLRQVAFEAQERGLLPKGDFRLTDDILDQLRNTASGAAEQLLRYTTPEQRAVFYESL